MENNASITAVAERLGMVVKNGKTLCPNHDDHHESLSLSDKDGKSFAKCFACNWWASPADLVMKVNGVEFPEAKEWLERKFGNNGRPVTVKKSKDCSSIFNCILDAGKKSSDYLIRDRKLKPELVDSWGIREYSPAVRKKLEKDLIEKFPIEDLVASGVFLKGKGGHPFFNFYDRSLIFPFYQDGRVVSLQGRIDPQTAGKRGKYIHLAGSKKANTPYGLQVVKPGEVIYIVEGLIDTLTLNSIGIPTVGVPGSTTDVGGWHRFFPNCKIIHIAQNDKRKDDRATAAELLERNIARAFWKHDLHIFHIPAQFKDLNEWHVSVSGSLTKEILEGGLVEIIPEKIGPMVRQIQDIKFQKKISADEKLAEIRDLVMADLKTIGRPFVNRAEIGCYFFNDELDKLVDTESLDFKTFLFNRYEMSRHDQEEIERGIQAFIWIEGAEIIPQQFSYFDKERSALYLAAGSFYKITSTAIEKIHNGADGVFFKNENQNINIELPPSGIDYFADGFSWEKFKHSLLYKYLISYGHFTVDDDHSLTPDELRYILVIYFYGLIFETLFADKPILTICGIKQSGKTTLSTLIGKLLFGKNFSPSFLSENRKDLHAALANNRFLVLDNLDSRIDPSMISDLCAVATGGKISERKLFLNGVEVNYFPRVFIVLTSRTPYFKRDDLVSRLLIFYTSKIKKCMDAGVIYGAIEKHLTEIWAEIFLNLQSIVKLLEIKKDWAEAGVSRNSSFELFAKKIHGDQDQEYVTKLFKKMNSDKNKFGLEDDLRFTLLGDLVKTNSINYESAADIFALFADQAKKAKTEKLFDKLCSGPTSLSKWLVSNEDELKEFFTIETSKDSHSKVKLFSIAIKGEIADVADVKTLF